MFRGELFGAQHITRTSLRKHFSLHAYAQMPCFLGPREHAMIVAQSHRAKIARTHVRIVATRADFARVERLWRCVESRL